MIKTLRLDKGFGFIRVIDGTEYFFHRSDYSGFWNDLQEHTEVEFEPTKTPKGPRASNVVKVNEMPL